MVEVINQLVQAPHVASTLIQVASKEVQVPSLPPQITTQDPSLVFTPGPSSSDRDWNEFTKAFIDNFLPIEIRNE